jgi:hypothetical protein
VFSGTISAACLNTSRDDELQLTNSAGFKSQIVSFILSKSTSRGLLTDNGSVFLSVGYAYTDAHDRRNMYNSTAGSNFDNSAAFDRQNPAESRGFFSSKHNISAQLSFEEEFFPNLSTRLGATFVARSGRPYSLTFAGSGAFADSSSGSDNALIYLPTGINDPNIAPAPASNMAAVQLLADFAKTLPCAAKYIGTSIPRNTCSNDWYYDLDLSFSQELPGPGRLFGHEDKIKLYATMDNFLNFLDRDWNVQRRRDFAGRQDLATTTGVDAQGRYIITNANNLVPNAMSGLRPFDTDNGINVSSSVWRVKVGISYNF